MAGTTANIRLFGALHTLRKERGLPTALEVDVPEGGMTGAELAHLLGLPLGEIEGLFCNHTVYPVSHRIFPGDEVAFVPEGTPGPHRFFLGLYKAGLESAEGDPGAQHDSDKR